MTDGDAPIDEERRRRFEAHRVAGGADAFETFLPDAAAATYAATLEEIVAIDLEFRWKRWAQDGAVAAAAPDLAAYDAALSRAGDDELRPRLEREQSRLRTRFTPRFHAKEGARLAHYVLRARVGRGAFAEVWRAFDERLHRDVAMKLVRPELADDPQIAARLVREAQSAARLSHPGIVPVHEVGEFDGRPYIVSDFVEGETLMQAMRGRRFTPDEAARLVFQLAEALDYAHAFGVVHRDVKPGNVLLTPDGRPLLADFGLAQLRAAETSLTRHGEVVGTPAYMSPEQARGEPKDADARSDVYSLGVVLYELLTGALPFERASSEGLLYAVVHEEPPAPRTRDASVPADIDTICVKAMAKEKDRRYASAREFAEDLRRYLDRRPILARNVGLWERTMLWTRRNPALATTIVVGSALVLLVGGVGLARVVEERRRFREERDRANAHLYKSLVTEAQAHLEMYDSEWRDKAMDALRSAAALDVPVRDVAALRTLVLACETSAHPSFHRVARWPAVRGTVVAMAASPDGTRVAAATDEGAAWVRDTSDGRVVASGMLEGARATKVAFVSDDKLVVACDDGSVRLVDATTLQATGDAVRAESPATALASSPAAGLVAVGRASGGIDVVRVDPAAPKMTKLFELEGHEGGTYAVAFGSDGRRLASGGEDRWVRLWDVAGRRVVASQRATDPPRGIAVAPDGKHVAWCMWETGGWGLLALAFTPPAVVTYPGIHLSAARDIAFTDDTTVLTCSADGTMRASAVLRHPVAFVRPDAGPITAQALLPRSTRIVAAHAGGEILVWDFAQAPEREIFTAPHLARFVPGTTRLVTGAGARDYGPTVKSTKVPTATPGVTAIATSADGVAIARAEGGALAWTGGADRPTRVPNGGRPATRLAASPDGSTFAVGGDDGEVAVVRSGDVSGGGGHNVAPALGEVRAVAMSRDGFVGIVCDRGVATWRAGGVTATVSHAPREVGAAVFVGETLAVGAPGGRIEFYDARDGSLVRTLDAHADLVTSLAASPDGRRLVSTGRDHATLVWDTADWTSKPLPKQDGAWADWVAVDPRGEFVARGGVGWADVVDLATSAVVAKLDAASSTCGAFAADGATLYVGLKEGGVPSWSRAAIEGARAAEHASDAPLEADGALLGGAHRSLVWGVAVSADGKLVATTSHEGDVKLWDAQSLALLRDLRRGGGLAWSAAFSPDGKTLAVCSDDQVLLMDPADGRVVLRLPCGEKLVTTVAFHPTRPYLACGAADGVVRIFDARDGRAIGALHRGATSIHDLAFSPDGSTLAAATGETALVWNAVDADVPALERAPDRRLDGGGGSVWAVTFDRQGRFMATGTERGIVLLRDARTFDVQARLAGDHRLVRSVSFDDAGRFLAAGCYNGLSVTWDLPALRGVLAPMGLDWK